MLASGFFLWCVVDTLCGRTTDHNEEEHSLMIDCFCCEDLLRASYWLP